MKPQLISFKLCPFVQRSVILLKEKGVDYDITYIDLNSPPGWFKEISPLGKVPVLRVGEQSIFESTVIMEYLDEVNPPSLHPSDPLRKALNRAWMEFGSELFMGQFQMIRAPDAESFEQKLKALKDNLAKLETHIAGPFFNGDHFNLIDAAYAPLFMRAQLLETWHPLRLLKGLPKVEAWSQRLLDRDTVKESVIDNFSELFRLHIANSEGYGAELFDED
ncbi:glutathione S-transferase family protein [Thiohalomonas denitrificans]|uniref:glutathione S-transferase family protein n=1 Tax=Thiohalomonas denitrificans TaxID=415747 RepID=UPI0026EB17CD|nr:glutathione S-transferase family protein [Thiohalomonas denitrificans]